MVQYHATATPPIHSNYHLPAFCARICASLPCLLINHNTMLRPALATPSPTANSCRPSFPPPSLLQLQQPTEGNGCVDGVKAMFGMARPANLIGRPFHNPVSDGCFFVVIFIAQRFVLFLRRWVSVCPSVVVSAPSLAPLSRSRRNANAHGATYGRKEQHTDGRNNGRSCEGSNKQ